MKKTFFYIFMAIAVVIMGWNVWINLPVGEITGKAQKTAAISSIYLGDESSTHTPTYLYAVGSDKFVASTTWAFEASRISEEDREIEIYQQASGTGSILRWHWETSYDQIAWYRETIPTTTTDTILNNNLDAYDMAMYEYLWVGEASSTMFYESTTTIPIEGGGWDDTYVNRFTIKIPELTANYLRLTIWEHGAGTSTIWMALRYRNIGS